MSQTLAYAQTLSLPQLQEISAFIGSHRLLLMRYLSKRDEATRLAQAALYDAVFSENETPPEVGPSTRRVSAVGKIFQRMGFKRDDMATRLTAMENMVAFEENFFANDSAELNRQEEFMRLSARSKYVEFMATHFNLDELKTLQKFMCTDAFATLYRTQADFDKDACTLLKLPHVVQEIHRAQDIL